MSLFVDIEKTLGLFHLKVCFETGEETLALLGPSGCGKSMTLKCIAGIEKPDKGIIVLNGVTLFDSRKKINLPPQKRKTGLMFQNYGLFPNMTVWQNIKAGAVREKDTKKKKAAALKIMEGFGLLKLSDYYPSQLSGGQQQRVALARILVSGPDILLLDEPFSALDAHLRFRLEQEVREVIRDFGKTVLLVSHDRDEVFRMSDRIAVMHNGKVETFGTRKEVFAHPGTRNSAVLTGCKNISRINVLDSCHVEALDWGITLKVPELSEKASYVGIRMHDVRSKGSENIFQCRVVEEIENPFSYTVMLKPETQKKGALIGWEMEKDVWNQIRGSLVEVSLPADRLLMLRE